MSEVVNATELEGLLTGGLLAKLIAFVKSGVITAAMNEAEIIAALKAAGVTVSPSTESLVALLCKIILSVVSTAPVQDAAPLGRVALLAKAAAVYADCFGGAKDTPFLNHLRAMRTFANVHQLRRKPLQTPPACSKGLVRSTGETCWPCSWPSPRPFSRRRDCNRHANHRRYTDSVGRYGGMVR